MSSTCYQVVVRNDCRVLVVADLLELALQTGIGGYFAANTDSMFLQRSEIDSIPNYHYPIPPRLPSPGFHNSARYYQNLTTASEN